MEILFYGIIGKKNDLGSFGEEKLAQIQNAIRGVGEMVQQVTVIA